MDDNQDPEVTIEQLLSNESASFGVSLTAEDDSNLLGSKSDDKYRLGAEIAKGGMGAVLKAKDINIRRKVAMKVMLDRTKASKEQVIRFIEEAQVTGQLEHPNIVPVHELGIDDEGNPFYTMKMIKGVTLKEIVKKIKTGDQETIKAYPLTRLLNIFLQACNGVSYAHSKGVVHRDLKPENIMVGEYGEVLVVDWGLAKILGKREIGMMTTEGWDAEDVASLRQEDDSQMTMVGQAMGTPAYMAPEQAEDASSVDEKADIYAMGGVLYNLLTLRNPVIGNSLRGILINVVQGNIIDPAKFNDSSFKLEKEKAPAPLLHLQNQKIPSALTSVTMKALALKKEDRYSTVSNLQKDLQAYLDGFATEAEHAGVWTQLKLLIKRNKALFGSVATAVVILAVVIGISFKNVKESEANALRAKGEAETAKENAVQLANSEKKLKEEALYSQYVAMIRFINNTIYDSDYEYIKNLLQKCHPDYRNWEWERLNFICNQKKPTKEINILDHREFENLSEEEKEIFSIYTLQGQVCNGGFEQYYNNGHYKTFNYAQNYINKTKSKELIFLFKEVQLILKDFNGSEEQRKELSKIDYKFYESEHFIDELFQNYYRKYKDNIK